MPEVIFYGGTIFFEWFKEKTLKDSVYVNWSKPLSVERLSPSVSTVIFSASPVLAKKYGLDFNISTLLINFKELVSHTKPRKIIFISSVAVYGLSNLTNVPFFENARLNGESDYAKEKKNIEDYLFRLKSLFNFELVVLRPSGLFNVPKKTGRKNLIDILADLREKKQGKILKIEHNGQQIRDFCNFFSLVELLEYLVTFDKLHSSTYNLSSTHPIMIRKLVKIFEADEFVSFQPNISDNIHNFVATNKLETEIKKKKGLLKHLDKRELSDIVK